MFGRDITSASEIAYAQEFVEREAKTADRLRQTLGGLATIPADSVAGEYSPALLNAIYEQHLLLKRWLWRRGILRAAHEAGVMSKAA
jgi:hypothetical protein